MRKIWCLALPLTLLVGACGDDDDDKSDKKDDDTEDSSSDDSSGDDASVDDYVEPLVASMEESGTDFGDDETNECVNRSMVEAIGIENLQGKVTPEELAAADTLEELDLTLDAEALWNSANDCTDIGAWLMNEAADGDETAAQCLVDATTEEQRKDLFLSGFENREPSADTITAFDAARTSCLTTDETTDTTEGG